MVKIDTYILKVRVKASVREIEDNDTWEGEGNNIWYGYKIFNQSK